MKKEGKRRMGEKAMSQESVVRGTTTIIVGARLSNLVLFIFPEISIYGRNEWRRCALNTALLYLLDINRSLSLRKPIL